MVGNHEEIDIFNIIVLWQYYIELEVKAKDGLWTRRSFGVEKGQDQNLKRLVMVSNIKYMRKRHQGNIITKT